MKIADYSLAMQSSHSWSEQRSATENLRVWSPQSAPLPSLAETVTISPAARQKADAASAADKTSDNVSNDPNMHVLIMLIERLTGQKVRVFDASQLTATHSSSAQASVSVQAQNSGPGMEYSRVSSYSVSEQTTLQASGVIRTQDGQEISFNLNLSMQFQYSETSSTSLSTGNVPRKTDPLVINFNGNAAQLSSQRFAFDLNADGTQEQISAPVSGSGFLALDLNDNGKIDNGKELFGPASGNGFGELAQYDADHNGWIDENDAAFQLLKVWSKDAAGNDKLDSLASSGVGAISLQSVATPFDLKTARNQLLGTVRSSGAVINENGSAGSVQQIDLAA